MKILISLTALTAVAGLIAAPQTMAAGDKNAYNNPTGDPPTDTYQTPFANAGGGRMLVFCADDETLILTPTADGSVEITCMPAAD